MPTLQGEFSLEGRFPEVRDNVKLVQGLFNESLPPFIKSHYKTRNPVDITYLHIDCDLYAGMAAFHLSIDSGQVSQSSWCSGKHSVLLSYWQERQSSCKKACLHAA